MSKTSILQQIKPEIAMMGANSRLSYVISKNFGTKLYDEDQVFWVIKLAGLVVLPKYHPGLLVCTQGNCYLLQLMGRRKGGGAH